MDDPIQNIVKNIAQELDCGFDCYYNSKTNEIIAIPSFSQFLDEEHFKEAFQTDLQKIKKSPSDFIKFEALRGFESFKIMELFVGQITDKKLKTELKTILTSKKPFQNFKHKIDQSNFRQSWFEFKQNVLEQIVERQLDSGIAPR